MHAPVFYMTIAWLVLLLAVNIVQMLRKRGALESVLAVDATTLLVIGILVLHTLRTGSAYYLDPALVVGLLSFAETLVAVRFLARGGIFK